MKSKLTMAIAALVAGCAAYPDRVDPAPTSAALYEGMSCEQIRAGYATVETYLADVSGDQERRADKDTQMAALGFLAWPAWFAVGASGPDKSSDIAMYKGELAALYEAGSKARCWLPPPPNGDLPSSQAPAG